MSNAQKALDEYEARPVAELVENAEQLIYAMCRDGAAKHWRMSVPVHPGDSDIILTAALNSSQKQIADLQRQNALLRVWVEAAHEYIQHEPLDLVSPEYWQARQAAIDGGAMGDGSDE